MTLTAPQSEYLAQLADRLQNTLEGRPSLAPTDPGRLRAIVATAPGKGAARLIRIRLMKVGELEPQADSDAGLPADHPGTWTIQSLTDLVGTIQYVAAQFHNQSGMPGLDKQELERRISSLRVQLSRRGGSAVLRAPYKVEGSDWLALVAVSYA